MLEALRLKVKQYQEDHGRSKRRLDVDEKCQVLEALAKGATYREVADQFDVSIATVSRIVNGDC